MNGEKSIIIREYESPCGRLMLGSFGESLCLCDWLSGGFRDMVCNRLRRTFDAEFAEGRSAVIDRASAQLDDYFAGCRQEFDLPLLFAGTDFQKTVWNALLAIPYGKTVSYGDLARQIGRPKAVRAVANANGANAISIFVPCHRVIGRDRSLTGYAGGLMAKNFLLELEKTL